MKFILTLAVVSALAGANRGVCAEKTGNTPGDVPLTQMGPTTFQMGKVQFDKARKTVSFPAIVNMTNGLIEYAIVTVNGKTHESVFRTEAEPYHIHLAMLLLGAKGAGKTPFPEDPKMPLPGERVSVEISWRDAAGLEKKVPAEDFVFNRPTKTKASRGFWIYNGSRMFQGEFIAQRDGSIVSIMTDPDALINNPRPGHEDDEIWDVNFQGLPALNSPVQVTIQLQPSTEP